MIESLAHAARLVEQAIAHAGPYGVDPACVFAGLLVAATMVPTTPPGGRRALARLVLPSAITTAILVLGTLFRTSGHKPAGAIVARSILALAALGVLAAPWIVWRAKGHRVAAALLVAFQLCFTSSMAVIAAMSVEDDGT